MYCGRCGAEIKDKTARFCDNCGAPLETGGGQNDYGSEDTYNGRGNRRNGTYSGTGTYNDGGNGTYGTYDQPYNNGGNGTYNRSHNNRGNGTYNGTYNRRTGQNQQDDNLIWDDGLPEVPDNRGNKGDQKKWLISIGCTVGILVITVVVLALLLGKNSGGSASDIVVNITQAPKAETSQNSTKTAKADTEEKQNTTASNQSTTKNSSTQKSVKIAIPTPSAATDAQELQITNEQKPQSSSAQKKQSTVQPSKKSTQKNTQSANTQSQQSQQTQQSASQSQADKDLEALRNAPVQEYTMPEESTNSSTQSSQNSTAGTTSGSSSTATTAGSGDYIFPESNSAYLTRDQLEGLSKDQLAYARNEIYARHGRRFQDQMFQDYFNAKSWYVPQYDPDQFDAMQDTIFNEYEKANAKLILEVEQEHGYTY